MINIRETFKRLTSKNYPYTKEFTLIESLKEFEFQEDNFGNFYILVNKEDGCKPNSMFTCHLDTYQIEGKRWLNKTDVTQKDITHIEDGDFIYSDGKTILGADDKAGMTIMLNMIDEKIPGLYYFFIGEEIGRLGSKHISNQLNEYFHKLEIPLINKCISFDRKDYHYITTKQLTDITASDEFVDILVKEFNEYGFWFIKDDTGKRTDSHEFANYISECTNISVGYFNEHTVDERQDIEFLELLAVVCTKIDWENLPVYRDIKNKTNYTVTENKQEDNEEDIYNLHSFEEWYARNITKC